METSSSFALNSTWAASFDLPVDDDCDCDSGVGFDYDYLCEYSYDGEDIEAYYPIDCAVDDPYFPQTIYYV